MNSRLLMTLQVAVVAKYSFLNRLLTVGIGETRSDGRVHLIEEIQ